MNRLELIGQIAVLKALLEVSEEALKRDAAEEFVNSGGLVPSWRAPDGTTVTGSMTHDACVVDDNDAFMAWLVEEYPQLVHAVVVPRNPEAVKDLLETMAELGPAPASDGTVPKLKPGEKVPSAHAAPGVSFRKGGEYITASLRVDPTVKHNLKAAARNWLTTAEGPMFSLEAGEDA